MAGGLGIAASELLALEETLRPKATRRSSLEEPSFDDVLEAERRSVEAAGVIADYERLVREHRMAWREAIERLAETGDELLASGAFDRSRVEQFFADVAAVSPGFSRALRVTVEEETTTRRKYKGLPTAEDVEEMWATGIAPAGARLLEVSDKIYAAAAERFSGSELEALRRKRDEARRALGRNAA